MERYSVVFPAFDGNEKTQKPQTEKIEPDSNSLWQTITQGTMS